MPEVRQDFTKLEAAALQLAAAMIARPSKSSWDKIPLASATLAEAVLAECKQLEPSAMPLSALGLSVRLRRACHYNGIESVPQLVAACIADEVQTWRNCGTTVTREARDKLTAAGLLKKEIAE